MSTQTTASTRTPAQQAGKKFETLFSAAFREYARDHSEVFHRIPDGEKNRQPCDYFYVGPDITLFIETKSTSFDAFPLENIRPHQLEACTIMDKSSPHTHAGFVIQFNQRDNEVWYISALNVQSFIKNNSGNHISREYLSEHGIRIPTFKLVPKAKTNRGFDFGTFLEALLTA